MSTIDQCPSTKGKQDIPDAAPALGTTSGRPYWRSVEEYAGTDEFREFVEREFPVGASELSQGDTRREFLKLMAASFALAGLATVPGCRRPDHKILAYSAHEPEHVIPGKPLYFATSLPLAGGGAEGLLVETHQGRPTKIEGNPMHPVSRGKSSVFAQAEILRLYDPDRPTQPKAATGETDSDGRVTQSDSTWEQFKSTDGTGLSRLRETHASDQGAGLAVVCDKAFGPTMSAMRRRLLQTYPQATWVWWDSADMGRSQLEGTRQAFGRPMRVSHRFEAARCIVSLSSDFLEHGADHLVNARAFAATRRVERAGDEMSRLYVAEPVPTGTGSMADHRMRMSPAQISSLAVELAQRVFAARPLGTLRSALESAGAGGSGLDAGALDLIAQDLLDQAQERSGTSLIVAGPTQPAEVHALVAAMNEALGAAGRSVSYLPASDVESSDPMLAMESLAASLEAGEIKTLVTVNANPVHDAPAGLTSGSRSLSELMLAVDERIALDCQHSETMAGATWALNGAHVLESWGDSVAADGTIAPVQPMIAPIFEPAMSPIEFVALLAGEERVDGYELVRRAWADRIGLPAESEALTRAFDSALHDGVLQGSAEPASRTNLSPSAVESAVRGWDRSNAGPAPGTLTAVFATGLAGDGRYANCGWLQELPQMGTQVCWDNPALLSPKTAEELGLLPLGLSDSEGDLDGMYTRAQFPQARVATLTSAGGETVEIPVWIMPGMADGVVALTLGYGRTEVGRVGYDVGVNVAPLRTHASNVSAGATLARANKAKAVASTQNHWSLEGRTSLVRAIDKKWFDSHAGAALDHADEIYGTARRNPPLNLAEQLGELSHTPDNVSIYNNPQNAGPVGPVAGHGADFAKGPQWGMTIDMSTCNGCGVCTIACQSENNIPIVGKQEVMKGREMSWIRVDRYFVGDDLNSPSEMLHQPVACVHCENAPCETVCPVNATVHGTEGTNNMAYNRCIGTRYCANNCPYKVRRFNFFEWGQVEYNGGLNPSFFPGGETPDLPDQQKFNKNFIPPRLREKLAEVSQMKMNPDVTVRSRGVMEKCSYCIQRINAARHEVKIRGIWKAGQDTTIGEGYEAPIPDGFFQTACQQACPTESIVFGDILDPTSQVSETRASDRSFLLLGYLNTRPRTSHMIRVRNPNEDLLQLIDPVEYAARFDHDPIHHGGDHGGDHGDDHHDGSHDDGHGGDHGDGHEGDHGNGHDDGHGGDHVFIRPGRKAGDDGYAMSLRVLGDAASNLMGARL